MKKHLLLRGFTLACGALALTACVTGRHERDCHLELRGDPDCRPYRAGITKFNPTWDATKPLAALDYPAWVPWNDYLIGGVDSQWMTAWSFASHKNRWWFPLDGGLTVPVHVVGNRALAATRTGTLYAVDLETGRKAWEVKLGRFVARPMASMDNIVIAITATQQVYAIDLGNGATKWIYDAGTVDSLPMVMSAAPVIREKTVYLGNTSGDLRAVSLETGNELWKYEGEYSSARFKDVVGDIVYANNRLVYARNDGRFLAIPAGDGQKTPIWEVNLTSITTTDFRDGIYYLGCLNGDVAAFDVLSGRKIWQTNLGTPIGALTAGEKTLYVAGSKGMTAGVTSANGKVEWFDNVRGAIITKPFFHDDKIFFYTGLRVLYAYRPVGDKI